MTERPSIAFYAPMKSPRHPTPSGDRTMANLLLSALSEAGFLPVLASEISTFDGKGSEAAQQRIRDAALAEAERLIRYWLAAPATERPRLWFTYHVYYKSPDWLGPIVSQALGIPYAVAEASRAAKRAFGPWALGHQGAEAALDRADVLFAMTAVDREALLRSKPKSQRIADLPPFLDLSQWPSFPARSPSPHAAPRLLSVAMMRRGDKTASYAQLARSCLSVQDLPWSLNIVGDGEARSGIETLFSPFGERVRFHGCINDRIRLATLYAAANLFVWPAVNEAYGMALLEAQAHGCPVLAGNYGGVADVMRDGESGLLTPAEDEIAFTTELRRLLSNTPLQNRLSAGAIRFIAEGRTLAHAAGTLRSALYPLLQTG